MKKLYRSDTDKIVAGVIGGLGEYFEIDPTILRLVYILVAILTGLFPAVIGYVIAYLVVPAKPRHSYTEATYKEAPKAETTTQPMKEVKEEPVSETKETIQM